MTKISTLPINGFQQGDIIDLEGFTATAKNFSDGQLTISGTYGGLSTTETFEISGNFTTADFNLAPDSTDGTDVTVLCYLRGTRILTPAGETPIETLRIGDEIVTRFGGVQKIKFIGRQSFAPQFLANNHDKWPVTISAGALAANLPARDLHISPGHSMLLANSLILASSLINGITIRQTQPAAQIDYFQLEFSHHDCVRAEGAWSESFADGPGLRAQFQNAADFWARYPEYQTPAKLALCAPPAPTRPGPGGGFGRACHPCVCRSAPWFIVWPYRYYGRKRYSRLGAG